MHLPEIELLLRANDCQANPETQVILKFMRDYRLILTDLEHWRVIDATYVVPIRGVILYEKIPKFKYDGPISVEKREGLAKAIRDYLKRHILNMPGCHEDTISHLDFGYAIVLDFYNRTLEDVLAHDIFDLTLDRKALKDVVVGLIILHTDIIFHGDIKPQSIVKCGSSWKITDLQSSRKIGYVTCNAEKYNLGCCPPEVAVTLLNSDQTNNFYGISDYDIWYLGFIIH